MTGGTFFFVLLGVGYAVSCLFKIIDLIEKPRRSRYHRA